MPSNKLKRDPDADVAALISVLRNEPRSGLWVRRLTGAI